jgi:putative Mg2+ transporter-C (MgtC) family protein
MESVVLSLPLSLLADAAPRPLEYLSPGTRMQLSLADMAMRVGVAAVCSLILGLERMTRRKAVSYGTFVLVCIAACIVTATNLSWDAQSRVTQGVLTGVGFLGAGALVREGIGVHGFTTAALMWFTAGMGCVFGAGEFQLGLMGFAVAFSLVILDGYLERQGWGNHSRLIELVLDSSTQSDEIRERLRPYSPRLFDFSYERTPAGMPDRFAVSFKLRIDSSKLGDVRNLLIGIPFVQSVRFPDAR